MWRRRYCWEVGERMKSIIGKKGLSPIGILGEILIILAVIFILLAVVLVPRLTKQSDIVGTQIGGIQGDADKDGLRNFFDKCPCTFGDSIDEGCPATFTNEQRQEDVKKYNSPPPCGIVEGQTTTTTTQTNQPTTQQQKPVEPKPVEKQGPAELKKFQSIEIFGNTDSESDPPADEYIQIACAGWVGGSGGASCHSESNNCDGKFNLKPLKEGCWIMASEDDALSNDCGQAKVDDGTIIPEYRHENLNVDVTNNYQTLTKDNHPKYLFSWRWQSKSEYGSLLCSQGFWYGCMEKNDGKTMNVHGETYRCTGRSWTK